jgi:hypothetical protein
MSDWLDDEFDHISGKHNKHHFERPQLKQISDSQLRQYPTVGDDSHPLNGIFYMDWEITGDLPTDFDWRDMKVITPPKQ